MHRVPHGPKGQIRILTLNSKALETNKLGDPTTRSVPVYLPPNYDASQSYPLLVELASYTNSGLAKVGWKNFTENLPERLDRLIGEEKIPPVIGVFPDSFTALGGNQFLNSPILGNWADHLNDELVPFIESEFKCGGPGNRFCFGHSSGGYGALVYGLLYPHVWSGIACHAGDMGFDVSLTSLIPSVCDTLRQYAYKTSDFLEAFKTTLKPKGNDIQTLMMLCAAASYDPHGDLFPEIPLPFDAETAELIPERWEKWCQWDPVEMIDPHGDALQKLDKVYIDCGDCDQFLLQYGARRLKRKLDQRGISHVYEEFPDNHSGTDYRFDISLPYLLS